ncbi:MAG: ABC transporter substrate-binding protein [Planctomycetes bacterium]|nr:ABC transporter substrate-binding protein [Planctomycetota bacterium]
MKRCALAPLIWLGIPILGAIAGALALLTGGWSGDPGSQERSRAPQRIVSTARTPTEILFAIGAGDQVAGVCRYCEWPEDAKALPKVGGYYDLDFEALVALSPDLVVLQGGAQVHEELARKIRALGIETLSVEWETVEDVFGAIRELGERTGHAGEARVLATKIGQELDRVRSRVAGLERPSVLVLVAREPGAIRGMTAAGPGTYLGQLLDVAGGTNALAARDAHYPQVSAEELVAAAPDVILEVEAGQDTSEARHREVLELWSVLGSIPAVARGQIHLLAEDYLVVNGPRLGQAARRLAEVLHPEAFPE